MQAEHLLWLLLAVALEIIANIWLKKVERFPSLGLRLDVAAGGAGGIQCAGTGGERH